MFLANLLIFLLYLICYSDISHIGWHFWAIALWLTPEDPCMTFNPINVLHCSQGFSLPNLVVMGHSQAFWPMVDPGLPLHILWPHQCIILLSRVLPTKSSSHSLGQQGFFLPNLIALGHSWAIWPLLDPGWPLTLSMHCTLVKGSSNQTWLP